MASDKEGGNSGGWFPNFNHLLIILLTGTIFVSQNPFHESRPDKPGTENLPAQKVDARPWQDPFEAVEKFIDKQPKGEGTELKEPDEKAINAEINSKILINDQLTEINILAVMIPGGPYFEDSESRRKIRYAVLSGFDAALRYMPEYIDKIEYFKISPETKNPPDNSDTNSNNIRRVAYEWMVYKPTDGNVPPKKNQSSQYDRVYTRPPVLVLWLNNDDYTTVPHKKLKQLIRSISIPKLTEKEKEQKPNLIHVLGPYNSDNLQDFVNEMLEKDANKKKSDNPQDLANDQFSYYSPSATIQDSNVLTNKFPQILSGSNEVICLDRNETDPIKAQRTAYGADQSFCQSPTNNLHDYFHDHGISFFRVNPTDQDFAVAINKELRLRGIEPSKNNRVALIGEWDTLYGWHLPNTYAVELLKESKDCKEQQDRETIQDWDTIYDAKEQCIFRFSYLRGLDGEKNPAKNNGGDTSSADGKLTGKEKGEQKKLEDADGNSQFDYVRRLAAQLATLDQKIRADGGDAHTIKAIGVLGSDVYDKLLILEALRNKFPDAVFFTNGMDARLLQPEFNQWTRNLITASGFGLQLDRHLQRDIPSFRDSTQTAYFLATQLALAASFDKPFVFDKQLRMLADPLQAELDRLITPRIFELGRTRIFDLSDGPKAGECSENHTCIQPELNSVPPHLFGLGIGLAIIFSGLLFLPISKQCLQRLYSFYFAVIAVIVTIILTLLLWNLPAQIVIGLAYAVAMMAIGLRHQWLTCHIKPLFMVISLAACLLVLAVLLIPKLSADFQQEQYALLEGVSMWPTEMIRLLALTFVGYFIIEVSRFPEEFKVWRLHHLYDFSTSLPWAKYETATLARPICAASLLSGLVIILIYSIGLYSFGDFHVPYRGENIRQLDTLLFYGLLMPAFVILLVLVINAINAVHEVIGATNQLVDRFSPAIAPIPLWSATTLEQYAALFNITHKNDISDWVNTRFIFELYKQAYAIISYPLFIILIIIISISSYFDNWIMPLAFNLAIGFSIIVVLYYDYRLKTSVDETHLNALNSLKRKIIRYGGAMAVPENQGQLEKLIAMIENDNIDAHKSFYQNPIFLSLLIFLIWVANAVGYSQLLDKLI
ncbi:MAG: hypothetical protein PHU14_02105 [Methylovulum sp.]|nr:hypothetical protein [Methylovulum sp.]